MNDLGLSLDVYDFQYNLVNELIDKVNDPNSKQIITVKAPTGSGKTLCLVGFIQRYIEEISVPTAFIWLCPGKGNLEEQSLTKMKEYTNNRIIYSLQEALTQGFTIYSTTFINWELVTKKDNKSITDSEQKNLFDRIKEAERNNTQFIVIIDEEHLNNTNKGNYIINAFSAKNIIRVSATANNKNTNSEQIQIDDQEVIDAGLISKFISINESLQDNQNIANDYDVLIDLAESKRKQIQEEYKKLGKTIRPLVLVQFPNARPDTIKAVEDKLRSYDYTYENKMVAVWTSENKQNIEYLTPNDGIPIYLLMKQAISTGWDCPRAKILVKLRENMDKNFEIQTVGRIRRMPEATHYDNNILDTCYIYTLDEKCKENVLSYFDDSFETKRLILKDKCKSFTIIKENRDLDKKEVDPRDVLNKLLSYLENKFKLNDDTKLNRILLEQEGFKFGNLIYKKTIKGNFVNTEKLLTITDNNKITVTSEVNTHKNGNDYRQTIDEFKKIVKISNREMSAIMKHLFQLNGSKLELPSSEYFAFIINNKDLLKNILRELKSFKHIPSQVSNTKSQEITLPITEIYRIDPSLKDYPIMTTNSYLDYTEDILYVGSKGRKPNRTMSERGLEKFCEEHSNNFEWVYKNGDNGQQYFCIVYYDSFGTQNLFYVDYILKTCTGDIWLIEAKGGQINGEDKNIDDQVENKFLALKNYSEKYGYKFGFVRYIESENNLYINNTEYMDEMDSPYWRRITEVLT